MSLEARAIAVVLALLALGAGWWRLTAHYERIGYERAQAEYHAAAELQREANRGRAREAEQKFTTAAEARERFIVTTVKEIEHATQSLDSCRVPDDAVRLFNRAGACSDSAAACGPDLQVREAR